jgi:L,D-transpeptidase ErfK/SrfK
MAISDLTIIELLVRLFMKSFTAVLILLCLDTSALASVFDLPDETTGLIGNIEFAFAKSGDTLIDVARANDLGFDEIIAANIGVDAWLPEEGATIILPYKNLLPNAPRKGIVINVAEMRLYYFPKPKDNQHPTVITFPVSVGRNDWSTPLITTRVIKKMANPVWHPPKSVREEHASEGDYLPDFVQSGTENPLGLYALYLGARSYLIHGTNREFGIGMRVTHGCIRLYPEDIQYLYETVKIGTQVHIVNQPYKVGWSDGVLYLEAHQTPETTTKDNSEDKSQFFSLIQSALKNNPLYPIDWRAAELIKIEANGMPQPIGPRIAINTLLPRR